MKLITKLLFIPLLIGTAAAQEAVPTLRFLSFGEPAAADSKEDNLYDRGTRLLDESKWGDALQTFDDLAAMKGRRADAALYWKAYALNKLGRRQDSLTAIAALRSAYPNSTWLKDASALELEVKNAMGKKPDPGAVSDEDLKLLAINSLMNTDCVKAAPLIGKVLDGNASPRIKERALFVLAQNDCAEGEQLLMSVAKGQKLPNLQAKAIQYIGTNGNAKNIKALVDIYSSSSDAHVKQAVIQAYLVADDKDDLLKVAKNETSKELRISAIHTLGAMGATKELEQMYQGAPADTKHAIIQACVAADDTDLLKQIANNKNEDTKLRIEAMRSLGATGGKDADATLVQIYKSEQNVELRRAALDGMFVNDDSKDMIALAKAETDPQMKRIIIEKLSVMDSKDVRDFMLEILNK